MMAGAVGASERIFEEHEDERKEEGGGVGV
jgi:hypothetical protein